MDPRFTTTSEDLAAAKAARAKREELISYCKALSIAVSTAQMPMEDVYEAMGDAIDMDKMDPDFWTYRIMQHLYGVLPFGRLGRWFVPILLVYGLYKAYEDISHLISEGYQWFKTHNILGEIGSFFGMGGTAKDGRIARFGEDGVSGIGLESAALQAALFSSVPTSLALLVNTVLQAANSQSEYEASGYYTGLTGSTQRPVARMPNVGGIVGAGLDIYQAGKDLGLYDRRGVKKDRTVRDSNRTVRDGVGNSSTTQGMGQTYKRGNY